VKLIKKGKVKDIYRTDNQKLIFHFTDRISAFDVIMNNEIPFKGKVLCDFAVFWFSSLKIKDHFISRIDKDKILVREFYVFPIECIIRAYFYGSLYTRIKSGNYRDLPDGLIALAKKDEFVIGSKLPWLLFDPTTKSDEHDIPTTKEQAIKNGMASENEFENMKNFSIDLYNQMNEIIKQSNFILADVKFEFGRDPVTNEVVLVDSLGPDEYRLWDLAKYLPGVVQDSFDKQILRDWLVKTGFKKTIDDYSRQGKKPNPPPLPPGIVKKISDRYIEAYERITNLEFRKNDF
jgi:phosphoribosylaminoimidazole-succinocarboxamide synthase